MKITLSHPWLDHDTTFAQLQTASPLLSISIATPLANEVVGSALHASSMQGPGVAMHTARRAAIRNRAKLWRTAFYLCLDVYDRCRLPFACFRDRSNPPIDFRRTVIDKHFSLDDH